MAPFRQVGLALGVAWVAVTAAVAAGREAAPQVAVVRGIAGPEGPLVVDGTLCFVGWNDNALWKWDGRRKVAVHRDPKCGHNGLALTRQKTFLLACTDDPGAILELSLDGKELRRWDTDEAGRKLAGGVNDIAVAPNGGAYATLFGPYDGVAGPGELQGKVLYLAPGAKAWREVAGEINYANGVGVSPDGRTLYVCQTVTGSILKFRIEPDGTLSHRANFALLDRLTPPRSKSPWLGPDSLKIAQNGDVYVAQFFGGKILRLSPAGKLLHVFNIAAGDGTTNLAFDAGEKHLFVSVVTNAADPKAMGSIVRVENPR